MAFEVEKLPVAGGRERAFHHRGTKSDRGVIEQMFRRQEYALRRLKRGPELRELYETMAAGPHQPLILDAGANIGGSIVYFGLTFPRAHILALEPARNNFDVLQANAEGIDLDARCAAIGSAAGEVTLMDPGEGEWGYRTAAAGEGARVPVLAAAQLVEEKRAAGCAPYIAKIDIEGAESELFARDTDWVDEFPLLIIELHDWLLPRAGTSRNFLRCIAGRDRDFVYLGENVFSIRNGD